MKKLSYLFTKLKLIIFILERIVNGGGQKQK